MFDPEKIKTFDRMYLELAKLAIAEKDMKKFRIALRNRIRQLQKEMAAFQATQNEPTRIDPSLSYQNGA